jgi:hypothetical protein
MKSNSRREMNPRRTAKSVRSHEKTMAAYGKAAGDWERGEVQDAGKGHVQRTEMSPNARAYIFDGIRGITTFKE